MNPTYRRHLQRLGVVFMAAVVLGCWPASAQTATEPTTSPEASVTPAQLPVTPDQLRRILQRSDDAAAVATALADLSAQAADDPEAAFILGNIYFSGTKSVPKNYAEAEPLMQAAAASGNPLALVRLGDIYRAGGSFDASQAFAFYEQAFDLGNLGTAFRLAEYYRTGAGGVVKDPNLALKYYTIAEQNDDTRSLLRLGDIYSSGSSLGLDPATAVDFYKRAVAADNVTALVRLGDLYRRGAAGIAAEPETAIGYYEQAIDKGEKAATLTLAAGYIDGSLGRTPAAGVQLLQQATAEGVPGAAVALAQVFLAGKVVGRDTTRGMDILNTALASSDIEAGRLLIRIYVEGRSGVARNLTAARAVLDTLAPELDEEQTAFETLIIATAARPAATAYPDFLPSFGILNGFSKRAVLSRVYNINPNAYVFLIQDRLTELGYYQGSANGQLTASTIAAFNRACADFDVADDCRTGPLSPTARRSSQRTFF